MCFNSLFEMLLSVDRNRAPVGLAGFNSLFEMQPEISAPAPPVESGFNSLFEMQSERGGGEARLGEQAEFQFSV